MLRMCCSIFAWMNGPEHFCAAYRLAPGLSDRVGNAYGKQNKKRGEIQSFFNSVAPISAKLVTAVWQ